jgi:hypothetical protein
MSHFSTVVILPKAYEDEPEAMVNEMLDPFDENTEVEEYDRKCYCKGRLAIDAGYEEAEKKLGTIDELRDRYWALEADKRPAWEEWITPFEKARDEVAQAHPMRGKYDPNCEDCHGTGTYRSTYNPDSQWDWWRIGGRWDGDMTGTPHTTDNGFNFSAECETIENNSCRIKDIKPDFIPFAIVTPDGAWHEQGSMGWWGIVADEKDNWEKEAKNIFTQYPDHIAVLCDLHI